MESDTKGPTVYQYLYSVVGFRSFVHELTEESHTRREQGLLPTD